MCMPTSFHRFQHEPLVWVKVAGLSLNISLRPPRSTPWCHKRVNWSKMSQNQMNEYTQLSSHLLSDIVMDHAMILCDDVKCSDPGHTSAIERLY